MVMRIFSIFEKKIAWLTNRGICLLCLLACFNPLVSLAQTRNSSIVEAFCKKNKISIICDRDPKTTADMNSLVRTNDDHIAVYSNGIYTVHFKFDGKNVPTISHLETKRFILSILDAYGQIGIVDNGNTTAVGIVQELFSSVSTEEIEKMKNGVALGGLSRNSQELLKNFLSTTNMRLFTSINRSYRLIKATDRSSSVFRYFQTEPTASKILGMEGPFGPTNINWQLLISHSFVFQNTGLSYRRMPDGKILAVGIFPESEEQKRLLKLVVDQLMNLSETNEKIDYLELSSANTLGEFVKYINKHNDKSITYIIDDYISGKPLYAFGKDNTSTEALVKAATDLYGLDVYNIDNNRIRITKRRSAIIKDPHSLYRYINQMVPLDVRRWLKEIEEVAIKKKIIPKKENNLDKNLSLPTKLNDLILANQQQATRISFVSALSRDLIIKQTKDELVRYFQNESKDRVKINESPAHIRNLLSFLFFINDDITIKFLLNPYDEYPVWMKNFESLQIKANVSSDKKNISFHMTDPVSKKIVCAHSFTFP